MMTIFNSYSNNQVNRILQDMYGDKISSLNIPSCD